MYSFKSLCFVLLRCYYTSMLQPADQGIIQNLKVQYRQTMARKMLHYLDENKPTQTIDLKDAVFMMAKAWDNVSQTTIKNCWRKAGLPGEVLEPTHDPFAGVGRRSERNSRRTWSMGEGCTTIPLIGGYTIQPLCISIQQYR